MKAWTVKRGNKSVQDIPVYKKDGTLVDNLASATDIKFQVKKDREESAAAIISKTKGDGIDVDTPSTGWLRITLDPADTLKNIGKYFMAIEIIWSTTEKYEIILEIDNKETDIFEIKRGLIQ